MKKDTNKNLRQIINEFLCKYAQPDYVDEYGCVIRKSDGKVYKSGRVRVCDILYHLIIIHY